MIMEWRRRRSDESTGMREEPARWREARFIEVDNVIES
jgi:hypothetical protein